LDSIHLYDQDHPTRSLLQGSCSPLRREQSETTSRRTDLADLANLTNLPLELRLVFRAVVGASDARGITVDWGVGGGTNLKVGVLIEFDVNLILRASLGLSFDFLRLLEGQ